MIHKIAYPLLILIICVLIYFNFKNTVAQAYASDHVKALRTEVHDLSKIVQESVTYTQAKESQHFIAEVDYLPDYPKDRSLKMGAFTVLYFDESGKIVDIRGRFSSKSNLEKPSTQK